MPVSFLLLADGPFDVETLKPYRDEQWWARRDSMCRMSALGLWSSPSTVELSFLIAPKKDAKEKEAAGGTSTYSALSMSRNTRLLEALKVPSEVALINLWKKAFKAAEAREVSRDDFLSKSLDVVATVDSFKKSGSSAGRPAFDSIKMPDKRELLRMLQREAPMDYLRKHGLNGSEDLVLRKKNKQSIEQAAVTFNTMIQEPEMKDPHEGKNQLQMTYELLYHRMILSASVEIKRITLVLLHEDYPQELPVFGHGCGGDLIDNEVQDHLIICVLGAVRDMTRDEEMSALSALATMAVPGKRTVRAVGCNLGRTPEFTSKILAAIGFHATQGLLSAAVDRLDSIDLGLASAGAELHSRAGDDPDCKRQKTVHITALDKLAPVQGVSRTAHPHTQPQPQPQPHTSATGAIGRAPKLHFVFPSQVALSLVARALLRDGSGSISKHHAAAREVVHPLVQAVVVALWRSRISGESAIGSIHAHAPRITLHILDPPSSNELASRRLSLEQQDFVATMAREHRAAPCESQVLRALEARISGATDTVAAPPEGMWKLEQEQDSSVATKDLLSVLPEGAINEGAKVCALCGERDLKSFYSTAYALPRGDLEVRERETEVVVLVRSAADIIQVQHMAYHGRLLPALSAMSALKKAKKREKEKKKMKKKNKAKIMN